jgi:hypothetical protein
VKAPPTAAHFQQWLDDSLLERDDPRPSLDALEGMANDLAHIVELPGGVGGEPILAERARRFTAMMAAAEQYRAAVAQYMDYDSGGVIAGYAKADQALADAGVPPSQQLTLPLVTRPGRPTSEWPLLGHQFADRFIEEMQAAGYEGRLGRGDGESLTAVVGATSSGSICRPRGSPAA